MAERTSGTSPYPASAVLKLSRLELRVVLLSATCKRSIIRVRQGTISKLSPKRSLYFERKGTEAPLRYLMESSVNSSRSCSDSAFNFSRAIVKY